MTRIAAIAAVALCMASPALAVEVLNCADTDAIGFSWLTTKTDGTRLSKDTRFKPVRFTVKVISDTKRRILWPRLPNVSKYNCVAHLPKGSFHCVRSNGNQAEPIIFGPKGYTRAVLNGVPLGPSLDLVGPDIRVAYGTCSKF